MAASGSASSSSNIEAVRIRRRVPPEKRRRTAISCDLCKARRTKCIRPPPPPEASTSEVDPSQLEPCESCVANGRECVSLAPRKQRRYNQPALLEALVKAAFPDHDINDAETVSRLAQQMGVGVHAREVDSSGEGEEEVDRLRGKASEPVENSHSVLPAETIGASTSPQRSQCRPERSASPQLAPSHYEQDTLDVPAPSQPASAPPETTVPLQLQRDPLGRSQYIGPSGTLVFVSQIRELCRKAGVDVNSAFVRDNFVQALDAPQEGSTGAGPSAAEASGNPARLSTDDLPSRA